MFSPKESHNEGEQFGSHKYAGKSALRYELGVDIVAGNLVWIQGPYPVGNYTNIKKKIKVLRNFLEPGKRYEANEGYRSHPHKIKCPGNDANLVENQAIQGRVRTSQDSE